MPTNLVFLIACLLFSGTVASKNMCKMYLGGKLYNFETILPALRLNLSSTIVAVADLCHGVPLDSYKTEDYHIVIPEGYTDFTPNSLIINNENKKVFCVSFINDQKNNFWTATVGDWPLMLPLSDKLASLKANNSQEIILETTSVLMPNERLKSIKFKFKCERNPTYTMKDFYFDKQLKELNYGYTGPDACPLVIPDYIEFFSSNLLFLGLLFSSSFLGLFLGKSWERLAMSLTSLQAAVMVTSAFLISSTQSHSFKNLLVGKEKYFGVALASVSFLFFGLSYFSRYISVVFVCVSVSYTITWTILYLSTVLFASRVSFLILAISTGAILLLIVGLNWTYPQLRERYSFGVYTALTNPFFLVMSIAVYKGYYLDIISFNQFQDWGKYDSVTWKSWSPLAVQGLLSLILIAKSCFDSKSSSRIRSSTNLKKLTEQLNEDKNLFRGPNLHDRIEKPSAIIQL